MKTFAIFAKYWEKGKVKTRLAKAIGVSSATEIYLRFLRLSLKIANNSACEKILAYSPRERELEFRKLAPDWRLMPQVESDLGTRMQDFFERTFVGARLNSSNVAAESESSPIPVSQTCTQGADPHRIVLIGSDTPLLPVSYVETAFEQLEEHDVVLGPSSDGGYYLIGAREQTPEIFQGVDWSSDRVLDQTITKLQQGNYSYGLLAEYADVDELPDLVGLIDQLQALGQLNQDQLELLELAQWAVNAVETHVAVQKQERS